MPGDPRRARRIAQQIMTDARLVTEVRGIEGWTGTVDGQPLTVLASGMGVPSMMIYATELFRFYDVQRIVRVGTAGALGAGVGIGDVVIASGAHTDSSVATFLSGGTLSLVPSWPLLARAAAAGDAKVGTVLTSDYFYDAPEAQLQQFAAYGALAVEMEAAGLYFVAIREQRESLAIVTITDNLATGEALTPTEREESFLAMVHRGIAALTASRGDAAWPVATATGHAVIGGAGELRR